MRKEEKIFRALKKNKGGVRPIDLVVYIKGRRPTYSAEEISDVLWSFVDAGKAFINTNLKFEAYPQ